MGQNSKLARLPLHLRRRGDLYLLSQKSLFSILAFLSAAGQTGRGELALFESV